MAKNETGLYDEPHGNRMSGVKRKRVGGGESGGLSECGDSPIRIVRVNEKIGKKSRRVEKKVPPPAR